MHGLTVAEIERAPGAQAFLHRLFTVREVPTFTIQNAPSVVDYVDLALRGGFPAVVGLSEVARAAWLDGYRDELIYRDATEFGGIRAPERLSALLTAVAHNIAGSPTETSFATAAGIDVRTARTYLDLLEGLRIVERLPAWHSNRFTRLVKAPKYHLTDTGLAAAVIGVDATAVLRSGDLLGRLIESFVVAQLRPLLALASPSLTMGHLRERGGDREVDLVLESRTGDLVGVEVKAAAAISVKDAKHLLWMRDQLGSRFRRGIVMHTGPTAFALADRVHAVPIAALWRWPSDAGEH